MQNYDSFLPLKFYLEDDTYMVSSPQQKMSPSGLTNSDFGDLRIYKSIGSLIKAYRQWRKLSQDALAELSGIGLRELQRWEASHHCARIDNLHDLSEATGIPMQVFVALNADQPIWYSLRKRRYAYSSLEEIQFLNFISKDFYQYNQSDEGNFIRHDQIKTDKHIRMVLSCHRDLYGMDALPRNDVIRAASMILPDLNRIAFDSWGHYVGHQVCLPIKTDLYQEIKKHKIFENSLTIKTLSDIVALHEGVFYFYSTYISNKSIALSLLGNAYRFLISDIIEPKEKYLIVRLGVTDETKSVSDIMGAKAVLNQGTELKQMQTGIVPTLYEIKLSSEIRRTRNFISDNEFGEYFSDSARIICYGLCPSEEKIMLRCLRLLAKGVQIQVVSESLEIKIDTIHRWLKIVAEQGGGEINDLLTKKLKLSRHELEALLDHVRKNSSC